MINYITEFRIFTRKDDGTLDWNRETYDVESFGGVIPETGDVIVSPWVPQGQAPRSDVRNRILYEVVRRYINPDHPDMSKMEENQDVYIFICLEVKERMPTDEELAVIAN